MPVSPARKEITDDQTRRVAVWRVLKTAEHNTCAIVVIPERPSDVLSVEDGEEGYAYIATMHSPEMARDYADKLNLKLGTSPAVRECLLHHAMFPGSTTTPADFLTSREYTDRSQP
jgi:hypothetical protein